MYLVSKFIWEDGYSQLQEYKRIKIGISNNKDIDTKNYVLSTFSTQELKQLENIVNHELKPNYQFEPNPEPDMKTGIEIEEDYLEKIGSFFKSTGETISNKFNEFKNSESVQNFGNKASETASAIGQNVSEGVSNLWSKTKGFFSEMISNNL